MKMGFVSGGLVWERKRECQGKGSVRMSLAVPPKRVLLIGGTRFSGAYLAKELVDAGHDLVLFNRSKTAEGRRKLPGETEEAFLATRGQVSTIEGDRQNIEDMIAKLKGEHFDVVYDNTGRELADSKPLIDLFKGRIEQYVYMSSAGVYLKSDVMPHREGDALDPKSRHKGKFETEQYLQSEGIPYTAIRPTYIYGALNYNPLEEWFFERIDAGRPVPIPGHGMHLTGLGHVQDLATAMRAVIGNNAAKGSVYNIQDRKAVTFDGLARACAVAMGKDPESVQIVHYNPKEFDFGKKKAFPLRPQHFFTTPDKALSELNWSIEFDTEKGLQQSYQLDFVVKKQAGTLPADFETDDIILSKAS
uniref:NAD-dependent epimerase/dehydratase domain-containing protein n=1 Tax=Compsopogon caeruleus TaxID=31354 RepID=A0A7S1TDX6_9RHOD|eukprot:CAMPEP_0184681092 /NCGR_PEP_ID=MMETSP0312-20130426/4054_1 /TAXON_ID=31354 /ORGANISM="Compsopogon coeruleus, Strain SAG 36.94" /LENGTH=360 /DNA_ID=CAMNT_0027131701 /DNA_START=76 /DNA_END=1158 /DNA_ORIENTATION=-